MTKALGYKFDIGSAIVPVDLAGGANTGHRLHLANYGGVAIVLYFNNGIAAEAVAADVQQHTAATAGTSADLDVVTYYHAKLEAQLDGDEAWAKTTQSAASEVTHADWDDLYEGLVVIEVSASDLTDGYEWISVDIADTGAGGAHIGAAFYVMYDLKVQRAPENLAQPNA
jgi:hypothetical protein